RDLGLDILHFKTRGSLIEILARGSQEEVRSLLEQKEPLLLDILPLSLEEVFIYELSLKAYQVSDLLA
ncbi:MAG TPA: ABC transporter ATP-binding protein, partial [Clostridia bacterium]|nr:ABC transporter ATP-binding protein [Clostridia bacterium]